MLKIGLTGGIGSGKSTIAHIFEKLQVPVFYADNEAKKFLQNKDVKKDLQSLFGDAILDEQGDIIRANLAKIVFANTKDLMQLNQTIHPRLMEAFANWSLKQEIKGFRYVIMEAAILFEAGFNSKVDQIINISAPQNQRIQRVMKRDGVGEELVLARINNQWTDEQRSDKSNYTINNAEGTMVLPEVIKLHESFLNIKAKR